MLSDDWRPDGRSDGHERGASTAPETFGLSRPTPARRARSGRRVTIAQIAAQSGLSTATVSKVLNGKPDVSSRTRSLVQDALLSTGYRRRGSGEAPPLIDVVFHDFDSPWATTIIRGAAAAAQAEGLTVAFTALSEGDERRVWFDHITSRCTRGVILLLSQLTDRQRGELVARGLPFVVIDPTAEPGPEVSSVGANNWLGGLVATKHLVDLGHRRIAIITGPRELLCSRARLDGYRAALETAGLSVDLPQMSRGGPSCPVQAQVPPLIPAGTPAPLSHPVHGRWPARRLTACAVSRQVRLQSSSNGSAFGQHPFSEGSPAGS